MVRSEALRLAELAGPLALAVTQPVLGPFGESPTTFIATGATTAVIVAFAVVVTFGPLIVAAAVGAASRLGGVRARRVAHLVLLGLASAGGAVVIARATGAPAGVRLVAALAGGGGVPGAYLAWPAVGTFLRFASVAPLVVLGSFLFLSPTSSLIGPASGPDTTAHDGEDLADVVILVLDELPTLSLMDGEGNIDAERFPNLATLADTSTWYRNATTVSPNTSVAIPALLSGSYDRSREEKAPSYSEYPDNLFRHLAGTHELNVEEWTTDLCPPGACSRPAPEDVRDEDLAALVSDLQSSGERSALLELLGEARGVLTSTLWPLGEPDSPAYTVVGTDAAADVVEPALAFLGSLESTGHEGPRLDYLHAPLPHQPWFLLPSGAHYETPHPPLGVEVSGDRPGDFMAWTDEDSDGDTWAEASRSRHLLQLQWTDRLVGAVMDRLQTEGRWDDTVVVVTSDHGVAFSAGQSLRTPGPANELEIAWVPLLIKAPDQTEGEVNDENVLLVDVAPTVAALAGLPLATETDGIVLGEELRGDDEKPFVVTEPERFERRASGDVVFLEPDGFSRLIAGPPAGEPGDDLALWRHGRHGDMLGQRVGSLGVCEEPFATDAVAPPDITGGLWAEVSLESDAEADVVIAADGVVAGWAPTIDDTAGVLLTEPLLAPGAELSVFVAADGQDCALHELRVRQ